MQHNIQLLKLCKKDCGDLKVLTLTWSQTDSKKGLSAGILKPNGIEHINHLLNKTYFETTWKLQLKKEEIKMSNHKVESLIFCIFPSNSIHNYFLTEWQIFTHFSISFILSCSVIFFINAIEWICLPLFSFGYTA